MKDRICQHEYAHGYRYTNSGEYFYCILIGSGWSHHGIYFPESRLDDIIRELEMRQGDFCGERNKYRQDWYHIWRFNEYEGIGFSREEIDDMIAVLQELKEIEAKDQSE